MLWLFDSVIAGCAVVYLVVTEHGVKEIAETGTLLTATEAGLG